MVFSMDVGKDGWNGLRVIGILRICVCAVWVFMAVSLNSCTRNVVKVGDFCDDCGMTLSSY